MEYIPIDKENLPERFEFDLGAETFILEFRYNELFDHFTCNLFDMEEEALVLGEKLVLNKPMWSDLTNVDLPAPTIIPMDLAGNEDRVTFSNLGVSVFLYIDDEGDENE